MLWFGGLAVGAALTFAPLASADTISDAVSSEEALLNSIFVSDATLAGVPSGDYSLVDGFDVVKAADITDVQGTATSLTPFDYLLYGLNPADNLATDPGSYNVFNGALTEFADAYNVELYSLANPDALRQLDSTRRPVRIVDDDRRCVGREHLLGEPSATSSRTASPTWPGTSDTQRSSSRSKNEPPEDHSGGFVLPVPSRDCAAAPVRRYPRSA